MSLGRCLLACAIAALGWCLGLGTQSLTPVAPGVDARIEGVFPRDGHFHGEPLGGAQSVRQWGSLAGADANTGTILIGPFVAPARLRFGVTGFPAQPGNGIHLERVATSEQFPVRFLVDIGVRWNVVDCDIPAAWVGESIRLVARDGSATTWLGITEPIRGGRGEGLNGLRQSIGAWVFNGALLGLLWFAVLRFWPDSFPVDQAWRPLLAVAVIAVLGYVGFWIYFAHATAGKCFSFVVLLAAAAAAFRATPRARFEDPAVGHVIALVATVGLAYLALLHLFPSSAEFDGLAAHRFREEMPGDNTLPHNLAATLYAGGNPRLLAADYQVSDRPPLQSGWLLLTWPMHRALGLDERAASGTMAMWLQLAWIPAVYGLLRALRVPAGRAAAWTGVIALSGFCLQNTVYTWPKLAAGAFAVGAFGVWILSPEPNHGGSSRSAWVAAVLLGLAWLAHGGVAFSFLALLPWILWRVRRLGWQNGAGLAAILLAFALPWLAYQKLYDPPGNLLLKEHLAGVDTRDTRGVWTTIRDSYRTTAWPTICARKWQNITTQFGGRWSLLFDFSPANAAARRSDEFFHTVRALGWWIFAVPLLSLAWVRSRRDTDPSWPWQPHAAAAGWAMLTVVLWCLLMFHGGMAVIHQGAYAVLLTLFVLLSCGFERAGRHAVFIVGTLQVLTVATTYATPNATIHGAPLGWPVLAFATLSLAAVIVATALVGSRQTAVT